MPYVSLFCSTCNSVKPLDHYASEGEGRCSNPPAFPPFLRRLVAKATHDKRHDGRQVTVTQLFTCPRSVIIRGYLPCVLVPGALDSVTKGTALHDWCEEEAHGVSVKLTIEGIEVTGEVDHIEQGTIWDLKTHSENAQYGPAKGRLKAEEAGQVNLYRLGLGESERVERMVLCHGAQVSARGPQAWVMQEVPWMSLEQVLDIHPLEGEATTRELLGDYKGFHATKESHGVLEGIKWMPLRGRTMKMGKCTKCEACCEGGVKGWCDRLAGIASQEALTLTEGL